MIRVTASKQPRNGFSHESLWDFHHCSSSKKTSSVQSIWLTIKKNKSLSGCVIFFSFLLLWGWNSSWRSAFESLKSPTMSQVHRLNQKATEWRRKTFNHLVCWFGFKPENIHSESQGGLWRWKTACRATVSQSDPLIMWSWQLIGWLMIWIFDCSYRRQRLWTPNLLLHLFHLSHSDTGECCCLLGKSPSEHFTATETNSFKWTQLAQLISISFTGAFGQNCRDWESVPAPPISGLLRHHWL